jgi:hypothetical protein
LIGYQPEDRLQELDTPCQNGRFPAAPPLAPERYRTEGLSKIATQLRSTSNETNAERR